MMVARRRLQTRYGPAGERYFGVNGRECIAGSTMQDVRRFLFGAAVGIGTAAALGALMLPLRDQLSEATTALVLVVPVVAAVVVGGFPAGVAGVTAGFLVYDLVFIPPYYTLSVRAAQSWAALAVYAVVMLLVAQVVSRLDAARAAARRSEADAQRLFSMSQLLVQDQALDALLTAIVSTLCDAFNLRGAALLLPGTSGLEVVASSGHAARPADTLTGPTGDRDGAQAPSDSIPLTSSDRAVGVLLVTGPPTSPSGRQLLQTFANHAAVAIDRAQLREQAVRAELLEEVDRLRQSLVGAVSHDLRTPLATIKVATTTLLDATLHLSPPDTTELLELIDAQTDRLTRIVTNLLDMTRIRAGVLEVRPQPWGVGDLLDEALDTVRPVLDRSRVELRAPEDLPVVDVDHVLIGQVLANLLDNASRHAPDGSSIVVEARNGADGTVEVSVADHGPGLAPHEHDTVFDSFARFDTGGRAGLGLAIAKAFVEAHHQRIWADSAPGGGARFTFTLPVRTSHGQAA